MSRAQITLLLLVVLCGAVIYAWIATPKQRRIASGQSSLPKTQLIQQKSAAAAFPTVADLDLLGVEVNQYKKPQKNIFGPLYLPPKRRPVPPPPPKVTRPVKQPQHVAPIAIQPQGPEPIQPLDVLGYLNKAGNHTVFLASKQGDLYLVKTGDTFADNLIVNNISDKEITIGRKQTEQQVILLFGEAKSQRLPRVLLQSGRPQFKMPAETTPDKPNTDGATEMGDKKGDK
ncbi:MAG: hypothetical protein QNK24_00085 [Desulfuromusa sp.]|nr:hypothetical protein [Desulfuromusa sp.]